MNGHNSTRESSSGNQRGFTLVETLIAMLLLSVALLGMAGLMSGIIQGNTHSNRLTTATTLAQDRLEEIRRLGYSNTSSSNATSTEGYGTISDFSLYKRVTVTTVDSPVANMKTVTVTVFWDADAKSVVLKTLLSQ